MIKHIFYSVLSLALFYQISFASPEINGSELAPNTSVNPFHLAIRLHAREEAKVISITAGLRHACLADSDGQVYCWGKNNSGQLGIGKVDYDGFNVPGTLYGPTLVKFPLNIKVKKVYAEQDSTCALSEDDRAFCWGDWVLGYGNSHKIGTYSVPIEMSASRRFKSLISGPFSVLGIDLDGQSYMMSMKDGSPTEERTAIETSQFRDMASSYGFHTFCLVDSNGETHCLGTIGHTGVEELTKTKELTKITGLPSFEKIGLIFHYPDFGMGPSLCGILNDGILQCTNDIRKGPTPKDQDINQELSKLGKVQSFSMGTVRDMNRQGESQRGLGGCLVNDDSKVYCWMLNWSSKFLVWQQEGLPEMQSVVVSTSQLGLDSSFACGISNGGKAYCWGHNNYWQLGRKSSIPVDLVPQPPALVEIPALAH